MRSYFRIYRELLHCELMKDREVLQVWIHLCDLARFKETVTDGIVILPGQLLTSAGAIAQECDLSKNRVQYILRCLEKNDFIRCENIRNVYSLITVLEPDEKQEAQAKKATSAPKKEPAEPTTDYVAPVTDYVEPTTKPAEPATKPAEPARDFAETEESDPKDCCGLFSNVYLTKEEKRSLQKRSAAADSYIEKLSAYKKRTNKKYANDFAVLMEWICEDEIHKPEKKYTSARPPVQQSRPEPSLARYQEMNTDFFTAPASYDLERAEALARSTVPKLRKRNQTKT